MNEINLKAELTNYFNGRVNGVGKSDNLGIPLVDMLSSHDISEYRIPFFVSMTAGETEYERLKNILLEMRDVNNSFAGMKIRETEVYLFLSREYDGLKEDLFRWCKDYFAVRVAKRSHRDGNEEDKFFRLQNEKCNIFKHIVYMENSINYVFMRTPERYINWFLYAQTWRKNVEIIRIPGSHVPEIDNFPRECPEELLLSVLGCEDDVLNFSLQLIRNNIPAGKLDKTTAIPAKALMDGLAEMASDIQGMRFFLCNNFNILKSSMELGGGYRLFWEWHINDGIGIVYVADGKFPLMTAPRVIINSKGVIVNPAKPWEDILESGSRELLALNYLVFEMVWEKLSSLYEKIDFDSIRRNKDKENDEKLLLSCSDIADSEEYRVEEVESKKRKMKLGPLRYDQLTGFLCRKFGCEVRNGKGSEKVITRTGGKCFILGHHKNNPIHNPIVIKRILKGLNIPMGDWYDIVYAGGKGGEGHAESRLTA